ncbi:MAG: lipid-A-disaccharide synthase [Spirulinaceae cyanobacterium]
MRIFISTGEVSGDLQGALLVEALKRQGELLGVELEIAGTGGKRMAEAGCNLIGDTTQISSLGILEGIPFVLATWRMQDLVKKYVQHNPPDLLILIDYLDPNLSIGSYIRRHWPQVPIIYYIAPQMWVWSPLTRQNSKILEITDRLLAIFPGEATYFAKQGLSVGWVGHPLLDRMAKAPNRENARRLLGIDPQKTIITLLPASRKQELTYLLPAIFAAAQQLQEKLTEVEFLIPLSVESFAEPIAKAITTYNLAATIVENKTLEALAAADLAITKSGTVNLELALLNVPQVVVYKLNPLTMWIARKVFKFDVPFVSPANLVSMQSVVPELFQEEANPQRIVQEAMDLLFNPKRREKTIADYQQLHQDLGEAGVCDRAAREILEFEKKKVK